MRQADVSYTGRWFCFDAQNNAYRVRELSALGRSQLKVSRDYSVEPWRPVPGYLRIPDDFGKAEVTVIDGWPWPCLAKQVAAPATGPAPARYEHVVTVGKYQLPALPLWRCLAADSLFWAGALGVVWWGGRLGRARVRRWRRRCPGCGYSLRGLVGAGAACPECGRSLCGGSL